MESDRAPWLIICVSHLEWTESLFQRPQQVMWRLSQNHSVLFSYPVALREWGRMLLQGQSVRQRQALSPNLTLLRDRALLPGWGGRLPQFQRFNGRHFMRALCRAARHVPPQRRILWYYYPQYLDLIDALQPSVVVYECMDNYTALFSRKDDPAAAREFQALQRDESVLLQRADIIFYGAQTLMEERPAYRAKSHHAPTGVDVKHFARAGAADGSPPPGIGAIRRPILGYWGAIDNRIDFELLSYAAAACPDWSFVLLGPLVTLSREAIDDFLRLPNIHWLGPKQYGSIPDYARLFDVCLMPFKTGDEGRYLNPTKTLEYLATGKPVLSTRIPDVERFYRDTVAIARTPAEFVEAARQLLAHDTDAARTQRLAKAQNRSWETMVDAMWSLVKQGIKGESGHAREKSPVKILHINEFYGNLGGAERYLAEICGALAGRGWEPVVLVSAATTPAAAGAVRVHRLEPSFGLRSSRRAAAALKRILDAERPDAVHLHNIQYFLGPPLLRVLQARAPVIQTVHDTRVICPRWLSKIIPSATSPCRYPMGSHCFRHGCYPFNRPPSGPVENLQKFLLVGWELALLRRLDRILAPSAYMHEQLRLNGFPARRLETLPPFLNPAFSRTERDPTKPRIVFAGRLDEAKGIRPFLECLARLSSVPWTAQVAGSGPFLAEAKAIAARHGFADRVEFLGQLPVDSLTNVFRAARVVVMPSLMPESFGLTGLEALACGAPVVAFDSGGIAEWLDDGATGFRVPWGDVVALAARVRQLLQDDVLAETLGRQGQQRAQQFDREQHMDRLCQIYAEVATTHHGSAAA